MWICAMRNGLGPILKKTPVTCKLYKFMYVHVRQVMRAGFKVSTAGYFPLLYPFVQANAPEYLKTETPCTGCKYTVLPFIDLHVK